MFNKKKIEEIITNGKTAQWSYPKVFNALKEAGVEYYETKVPLYEIVYYGVGGSWMEPTPKDFIPVSVAETFDVKEIQNAIGRTQRKETDYPQFLREIAAGGVATYRVTMKDRTVAYKGQKGEEYVERVPVFEQN